MSEQITPHLAFKADVLAFCERMGMPKTTFGENAIGDPNFVADLERKGREPRWSTMQKVRLWMAEQERGAA